MLVSVIIPTYGDPKYLKFSINSVLQQTLQDFELIIVDDNNPNTESRIKTEQLIAPYLDKDKRVRYIQHEYNKNGSVARNSGISVANGKYISFLDSDDEYKLNRLEKCYKLMERVPDNIGGVYTGCDFRKNGKSYYVVKNVKPGNFLVETIAGSFMFCTGSNIFVRKSIVNELNGFDESFVRHQDYEFLVRFFEKYSLETIREVLVIKNNENINVPDVLKMIEIKEQYLNKYKYLIDNLSQQDKNYIFQSHYVSIAEAAIRINNKDIAKEYYNKSKQYGKLTNRDRLRRFAFILHNFIRS